jgi:hypothetical protein
MPISTRIQQETYDALKATAEGAGMNISEWLRREITFAIVRGHKLKMEPPGPRQVSLNLDRPTLAAVRKLSGGQISKWVRRVIATGLKLDANREGAPELDGPVP